VRSERKGIRVIRQMAFKPSVNLLRRRVILETVKLRAKAVVQNVSVRTDKGSVDYIDGFLDQMKRESK
jgi:hypothetical protein